jgi:hypothetical protein
VQPSPRSSAQATVATALLAGLAVALSFLVQGHTGFGLADEGYLWYGVQRVLAGEVPIRDFSAYEPGRYLWSAAWCAALGDPGLVSLRISILLFQWLGLWTALLLVARHGGSPGWRWLVFSTAILLLWTVPQHKAFDIALSIGFVAVYTALIERPTPGRCFAAGLYLGLAAIFGRNHGHYGAIAGLGTLCWLALTRPGIGLARGALLWLAGTGVGFAPFAIALWAVPGLGTALFQSLLLLKEQGTTNLTLPVPWPWETPYLTLGWAEGTRQLLIGLGFVALPVYAVGAGLLALRSCRRALSPNPLLVASALVALTYAHHAFARTDAAHLAQGAFAGLIGVLAFAGRASPRVRLAIALPLLVASASVTLPLHPGWAAWRNGAWRTVQVAGDRLLVDPGTAALCDLLVELADRYAPKGRAFYAAPHWPGAYALLGRRSPTWEIYPTLPRSPAFQAREIARLEAADPGFAIVGEWSTGGPWGKRFRQTHPLILEFLEERYSPVIDLALAPQLQAFRAPP